MADVLTLGDFSFDGYSTPASMMGGGRQSMVVHKLPGGARVIDVLGPDESNISWSGFFWGNNAYNDALTLDAMRAAGGVISLSWGGQFRSVIIEEYQYNVRRLPVWVEYKITCVVYQNPSLGSLTGAISSIDTLVISDLAAALSL